jgi:hypothetical protein
MPDKDQIVALSLDDHHGTSPRRIGKSVNWMESSM